MKRIIAVLLAVLMLASVLVACNKQNGGTSGGAQGDIFQDADAALERLKKAGRSGCEIYE